MLIRLARNRVWRKRGRPSRRQHRESKSRRAGHFRSSDLGSHINLAPLAKPPFCNLALDWRASRLSVCSASPLGLAEWGPSSAHNSEGALPAQRRAPFTHGRECAPLVSICRRPACAGGRTAVALGLGKQGRHAPEVASHWAKFNMLLGGQEALATARANPIERK